METQRPEVSSASAPPPGRPACSAAHAQLAEAVIGDLQTSAERGLSSDEAAARTHQWGANEIAPAKIAPAWRRFLVHINSMVVWILIFASVLSAILGEWPDALAILSIVLLNALLGFFQEERAEKALSSLRRLSSPNARVLRDGVWRSIPARRLVPGDCLELEAGDLVPADVRLLTVAAFQTQESALTGESAPVMKDALRVLDAAVPLADRVNMSYLGTVAAAGKASAVVVATGMNTELGRIAGLLQHAEPEPTPLQRRMQELGRVLIFVCLAVVAIVFVLNLSRHRGFFEVFFLSVSLAVAAVPEGLPAVVTIALALGLQRMVRRNALIRNLPSVETLGCVTVICTDKTGTLTCNEMTVTDLITGLEHYEFLGSGYQLRGAIRKSGHEVLPMNEPELLLALTIAARCNGAELSTTANGDAPIRILGDPTEGALLIAAAKAGIEQQRRNEDFVAEIPFSSERKMMSVAHRTHPSRCRLSSKGATETILQRCATEWIRGQIQPLTPERRAAIIQADHDLARQALRVLALAYRDVPDAPIEPFVESELTFVGLVGMKDPPRPEVYSAVRLCRQAGVRPVMVTGDHPATAQAIARELDLVSPESRMLVGADIDRLSDDDLTRQVDEIGIFARVTAEHKLRVVRAWQARNHVVAMTGDGVNDAPALQAANIGIAMGVTGTDVSQQAADMVLTDDNFASIVHAVEEGRGIYENIQKSLHYLLSSNASEVLLLFLAALVGWPAPLLAIQILWINLISDGLPALALAMEPPEPDVMRRPPRPPDEPIISIARGALMVSHGALIASVASICFFLLWSRDDSSLATARSATFATIAFAQLFYSFSCRSRRHTMPQVGFWSNLYIFAAIALSASLQIAIMTLGFARPIFGAVSHGLTEWFLILLLSVIPVTAIEVAKLLRSRLGSSVPAT
jgi:Ca2+-transporting ATPase